MDPESMALLDRDLVQLVKQKVLLALEQYESDDLFQQLLSLDSAIEALKESRQKMADEGKFPSSHRRSQDVLKFLQAFEELQTTVRNKFNLRARGLLRGGITRRFPDDFPDELLLKIVNYFDNTLDGSKMWFEYDSTERWNTITIKNIRLTCHRLCDISSHLLVPGIRVYPSLSSLEHLDRVASHPTISQGLRTFMLNIPDLRARSVKDFRLFSRRCCHRLGDIIRCHESEFDRRIKDFTDMAKEIYEIFKPSMEILPSWPSVLGPDDVRSLDGRRFRLLQLLLREYARIQGLCLEQLEILQSGRFARAIASAAARSRSNVCLCISNTWNHLDQDEIRQAPHSIKRTLLKDPNLVLDWEFVIRSTQMHLGHRWETGALDPTCKYPLAALYELPLAISAAGATLGGLRVSIGAAWVRGGPFPAVDIPQEQILALEQASKNIRLEALTFRMGGFHGTKSLSSYLSAVINPQIIRDLRLDLSLVDAFWAEPPSDLDSLGPLRVSATYERLETLNLSEYIVHLNELKKLLGVLRPGVNITFKSIKLFSGTWAEALDCIRSKAGVESKLIRILGSELDDLDHDSYWDLLDNDDVFTEATEYIRSVKGVANPFHNLP